MSAGGFVFVSETSNNSVRRSLIFPAPRKLTFCSVTPGLLVVKLLLQRCSRTEHISDAGRDTWEWRHALHSAAAMNKPQGCLQWFDEAPGGDERLNVDSGGRPIYRTTVEETEEEAGAQERLSIVAQGGPPSGKKQKTKECCWLGEQVGIYGLAGTNSDSR